ncbi:hypothetical protein TBLA_0E02880 [Henningerozyma blattae CBS 6284]|uniref:Uncharacterized protein n=1 Tax=Henningerozyma blattae (strain ATCC 34711 / CBS 6284 / DSM 70876 / NBRC 10599 / NRRL Y-10934 / UCD 77-7) TaxID=1071380 RepID=I2H4P1_HENB6|nr:hypothetical protein TBLA_0E02880 [Tetrapisispora blattae CBS 6284]CCH61343.1 hypothetical protein TBLA_0E02880 [Tetrapisispora blattae CBS 6284]
MRMSKRILKYSVIFNGICKIRYNNTVKYTVFPLALVEAALVVSFSTFNSLWAFFTIILRKFLLIFISSIIVVIIKNIYFHIDYIVFSKFLILDILSKLFSFKTLIIHLSFSISILSYIISLNSIITSEKAYQLIILTPIIYTLQHIIFDLDRPPYGYTSTFIQNNNNGFYFLNNRIIIKSILLSACNFILSILFWLDFNSLNFIIPLLIFLHFEIIMLSFNNKIMMGPIYKNHLLSTYSSYPIKTLLDGLKYRPNSNQAFVRVTAFQELSLRAISLDPNDRKEIYYIKYFNPIFKLCLDVIENTYEEINEYLITLEPDAYKLDRNRNKKFTPKYRYTKYGYSNIETSNSTSIIHSFGQKLMKSFNIFSFNNEKINKNKLAEKLVPIPMLFTSSMLSITSLLIVGINSKDSLISELVKLSLNESLIKIKNSIGVMGNWVEKWEDLKRSNLKTDELENESNNNHNNLDLISALYEVSVGSFLEIISECKDSLNDVILDDDVVQLSKWVLETYSYKDNKYDDYLQNNDNEYYRKDAFRPVDDSSVQCFIDDDDDYEEEYRKYLNDPY